MFARIVLAMIAMLPSSAVSCLAAVHEVGVFLRSDGGASPAVLDALRNEMDAVLNRAGFSVKWWIGTSNGVIEAEELIVVDLRGACKLPSNVPHPARVFDLELASTSVADSQILPFSSVDCGTFNNLIHASLARISDKSQRDFIYGRALARVLAHEFYHVLGHTHRHTTKGVAKKAHSAVDLMANRFDFDATALAHLRQVSRHSGVSSAKNQTGPESTSGEAPAEPVLTSTTENPPVRQ